MPVAQATIADEVRERFPDLSVLSEPARDQIPTFWIPAEAVREALRFLKTEMPHPYTMLYDLTAIDERVRVNRASQPPSDFTVVYHLLSFERNQYIRLKVGLRENQLSLPSITSVWSAANWYEREVWDLFGIVFEGHPHLERILMPKT